jgi:hypothetical protein
MTRRRAGARETGTRYADLPVCALSPQQPETNAMSLGTLILIVVVLLLVGAIPTWGYSRNWGYGPSGGLGLLAVVVLVLLLTGVL